MLRTEFFFFSEKFFKYLKNSTFPHPKHVCSNSNTKYFDTQRSQISFAFIEKLCPCNSHHDEVWLLSFESSNG